MLVKLSLTFGVSWNSLANSAGDGVAKVSPVLVRITPFIADGGAQSEVRCMGVSNTGGTDFSFDVRAGVWWNASSERAIAMIFFTSSSGVFRGPVDVVVTEDASRSTASSLRSRSRFAFSRFSRSRSISSVCSFTHDIRSSTARHIPSRVVRSQLAHICAISSSRFRTASMISSSRFAIRNATSCSCFNTIVRSSSSRRVRASRTLIWCCVSAVAINDRSDAISASFCVSIPASVASFSFKFASRAATSRSRASTPALCVLTAVNLATT